MTASLDVSIASNSAFIAELKTLFSQRFGGETAVFVGPEWHLATGEPLEHTLDLDVVWNEMQPRVVEVNDARANEAERTVLLAPVDYLGERWIVTCRRAFSDIPLALEAARACVNEFQHAREMERLTVEIDSFALQLTADFEELTFLRRIPDVMDSTASPRELISVAKIVLRSLQQLVRAEGVVLLLEGADNPFRLDDATNQHWVGKRLLEPHALNAIIEQLRGKALQRPFIQNAVAQTPFADVLPGVREFMLVPVCKSESVMGWLLVVNRKADDRAGWRSNAAASDLMEKEFGSIEATLVATVGSILATQAANVQHVRNREELLVRIVKVLVAAIEARDEYTCGHSERVALYSRRIADELGYSAESCERLYLTGLLHDVGKIGVSDAILQKPGRLTDEEFEEIKKHPDKGWAILHELEALNYVLPGVLHHHERVDGKGYPDHLQGDAIPWDGRILAVADAYDAMTSSRPYRTGMPVEKAEQILMEGAGEQWDSEVVQAFFSVINDINEIRRNYESTPAPIRTPIDPHQMPTALVDDLATIGFTHPDK